MHQQVFDEIYDSARREISNLTGLPENFDTDKSRKCEYSQSRILLVAIMRSENVNAPYPWIGRRMGKDHSTAIYLHRVFQANATPESVLFLAYDKIARKLGINSISYTNNRSKARYMRVNVNSFNFLAKKHTGKTENAIQLVDRVVPVVAKIHKLPKNFMSWIKRDLDILDGVYTVICILNHPSFNFSNNQKSTALEYVGKKYALISGPLKVAHHRRDTDYRFEAMYKMVCEELGLEYIESPTSLIRKPIIVHTDTSAKWQSF